MIRLESGFQGKGYTALRIEGLRGAARIHCPLGPSVVLVVRVSGGVQRTCIGKDISFHRAAR
jgi:hypothetical protein